MDNRACRHFFHHHCVPFIRFKFLQWMVIMFIFFIRTPLFYFIFFFGNFNRLQSFQLTFFSCVFFSVVVSLPLSVSFTSSHFVLFSSSSFMQPHCEHNNHKNKKNYDEGEFLIDLCEILIVLKKKVTCHSVISIASPSRIANRDVN